MDAVAHYNKTNGMKGVSMAVLRPWQEMYLIWLQHTGVWWLFVYGLFEHRERKIGRVESWS